MTRAQFKELENLLLGIDALVVKAEHAKESTPLGESESRRMARDFGALKEKTFFWISGYLSSNASKEEKHLLQEITAGLRGIQAVNDQYAAQNMTLLIRKLRKFLREFSNE